MSDRLGLFPLVAQVNYNRLKNEQLIDIKRIRMVNIFFLYNQ